LTLPRLSLLVVAWLTACTACARTEVGVEASVMYRFSRSFGALVRSGGVVPTNWAGIDFSLVRLNCALVGAGLEPLQASYVFTPANVVLPQPYRDIGTTVVLAQRRPLKKAGVEGRCVVYETSSRTEPDYDARVIDEQVFQTMLSSAGVVLGEPDPAEASRACAETNAALAARGVLLPAAAWARRNAAGIGLCAILAVFFLTGRLAWRSGRWRKASGQVSGGQRSRT
jgi:hypothetical protein